MLSALPPIVENHLHWWVAGAIVLFGLILYGFNDLLRFSPRRAWAISSVSFAESIRRRVLWITPLAILGVIVVSQLQKPIDEQDAIRQTIKFSLFATGLVVTVTAIILACTNLPKEIDTRVIYTVVTKPTTRLEIVVGKVIGFAKVSLAILLIMGLFTFGYLHLRAWNMKRDIVQRLASGAVDQTSRPTYEYWAEAGLLGAKTFERPDPGAFNVLAREPKPDDTRRWFFGAAEGDMAVPFRVTEQQLTPAGFGQADPGAAGLFIRLQIGFDASQYRGADEPATEESSLPVGVAAPTSKPATVPAGVTPASAIASIQILDENLNLLIDAKQINNGEGIELTDPAGKTPAMAYLKPEAAMNLLRAPMFFVDVQGITPGVDFSADIRREADPLKLPVCLIVPGATPDAAKVIGPLGDPNASEYSPALPLFRTRVGMYGQQLRGGAPGEAPVVVYRFRNTSPQGVDGNVAMELKVGIERGEDDVSEQAEPTRLEIRVINRDTNVASGDPVIVYPENSRTTFFNIPAAATAGGDFDVLIRNLSTGHYVGLQSQSLAMVSSVQSFDWNLLKSLSILWMLSILVVIIAIFCSTFLSWPIAIVLTLVILLGHWGVVQLGDSLAPGIGNLVVTDMGFKDPSQAKVVSASVEALSKLLNNIAKVLPDIGQFSAIEDIERGVTISAQTLAAPLKVLAAFGAPMLVLSYILLRNKEVAP